MAKSIHPVDERLSLAELVPLGLQHVLIMYAGAVAVPLIIGRAFKLPPEQIAAGHPATRKAHHRLGARNRPNETEAARRRDPEGRSQRSYLRAVGRMGSADGVPKERPGRSQVQNAAFLEREAHVGQSRRFQLISACSLLAAR